MTTVLIVALIISQLLTFYFLLLLNSKISKYKLIEQKQEAIIREMDDAISAYLVELKDENDRLVEKLTNVSSMRKNEKTVQKDFSHKETVSEDVLAASSKQLINPVGLVSEPLIQPKEDKEPIVEFSKVIPKTVVQNAYQKQVKSNKEVVNISNDVNNTKPAGQVLTDFEQQVVAYYQKGMSVEEIAKKTQKGKTEIELLIKFHA